MDFELHNPLLENLEKLKEKTRHLVKYNTLFKKTT